MKSSKSNNKRRFNKALPSCSGILFLLALAVLTLFNNLQSINLVSAREKTSLIKASNEPMPNLNGDKAKEYLREKGLYKSLGEAMQAARYSVNWVKQSSLPGKIGAFEASNPAQSFRAYFAEDGFHLVSRNKGENWRMKMKLKGFGYGEKMLELKLGEMQVQANKSRIEIQHSEIRNQKLETRNQQSSVVEWYENQKEGLEQGFTLKEAPGERKEGEQMQLVISLDGNLKAQIAQDGKSINFLKRKGEGVLRYDKLKSWDATGRDLTSKMQLKGKELSIVVDDREAKYPVTIDPFFTQTKQLTASDGAAGDSFGWSVSISNDTAIVGAYVDDAPESNRGSAYIFERNQGGTANNWGEVKKIVASDGAAGDFFGYTVSISNDTAIVGSVNDDASKGSAYIFERNQGGANNWGEVRKLVATDGAAGDNFGHSVDINDIVIVGAQGDDSFRGSSYIFQELANSTAAPATVSGQVVNNAGRGINRALVTLTDMQGNSVSAQTNPFGYFRFTEVQVGETYIVSVSARGIEFTPNSQTILVLSDINDIRFTGFAGNK